MATLQGERNDLVRDIADLENRLLMSSVELPPFPALNPVNLGEGSTGEMNTSHVRDIADPEILPLMSQTGVASLSVMEQEGPGVGGNGSERSQSGTPEPVDSGVGDIVPTSEQR